MSTLLSCRSSFFLKRKVQFISQKVKSLSHLSFLSELTNMYLYLINVPNFQVKWVKFEPVAINY